MARRLHPEERSLWNRVVETVKPLHPVKVVLHPHPVEDAPKPKGLEPKKAKPKAKTVAMVAPQTPPKTIEGNLDSHWDRRFNKGAVIPDISIDLHGQGLAGAHARLDHALEQAIHQRMRVVLLVTGKARAHDRASGTGRGAIASVVRDWLAASRHSAHIAAVRQAHPRHGGDGALYIVLKR
jgi:DNA-nicking Smr family endonuclease